jgi:hypothetical protein
MSLPACPQGPNGSGGFAGEVTRLNSEGQFKPFVYLNIRGRPKRRPDLPKGLPKGKVPPCRGTFLLRFLQFRARLATALALLIGPLALTVRILLLLSRLLAAALLAGFLTRILVLLTRVLVLLARILILVRHRDLPC